jgi:flagella basal body P-ring formation protein FlgA
MATTPIDEIRARAIQAVLARPQPGLTKMQVVAAPLDARLRLQRCQQPLSAEIVNGSDATGTNVNVRCEQGAHWSIRVRVSTSGELRAMLARRAMPRGSLLSPADFESRITTVVGPATQYVVQLDADAPLRLRLPLAAGAALTTSVIEQSPTVRRGQSVTLLARTDGLEIRVAAIAMTDGKTSERISVQNQSSHQVVQAIVRNANLVETGL